MPNDFNFTESYKNAPSRQNTVWDYMSSRDPNVSNRFNNYQDVFNYDAMKTKLDKIFGGYEDKINRNTFEDIGRSKRGLTSSLASRGITGGSVLNDALSSTAADINKEKYNALGDLGIGKAKSISDLMDMFNKRKLMTEQLASGVDKFNVNSEYRKGQGLGGFDMNWAGLDLQRNNQPGWLSDLMSGAGDAAQIAAIIASLAAAPPTGGASLAISDIKLKENLELVREENGFNVYRFNYIDQPDKNYEGVIAQEIQKIMPEAVKEDDGYLMVDYSKIGIEFKEV